MDIQKLGPYFDKFSRLADNDGFIDEESNKESYDEILAKIPDQKRREEVAQDKSIDFYEYLEATSAFSQAAIRGNRTLILSYSAEKTFEEIEPWEITESARIYSISTEEIKKEIVTKTKPSFTGPWDYGEEAWKFYTSIYKESSEELKKEIITKIEPLLKNTEWYVCSKAWDFYASIYKDSSEELKKEIRIIIDPLLKNLKDTKWAVRRSACEFYTSIYKESSQELKKEIRIKIDPLLKDTERDVRKSACEFYTSIYKDSSQELKKEIRIKIDPLLKDTERDVHDRVWEFYTLAYKDGSEELKKELITKVEPLLKDCKDPSEGVRDKVWIFYASIYKDSSEESRKEIIIKIEPLLKNTDWYVHREAWNFYTSIYKDSSEELKKEIRTKIEPLLKDPNADIRKNACEFYASIYKDSSGKLKKEIRTKIEPLLKDTDQDVRGKAWEFYTSLYKDSSEESRKEIITIIEPLLKDTDWYARNKASELYVDIYKDSSDKEKEEIKQELRKLLISLRPDSYQEEKYLISFVYSGTEIFDEYQNTRSIALFLLCLSPDKLKELEDKLDSVIAIAIGILQAKGSLRIKMAVGYNLIQSMSGLDEPLKKKICKNIFDFILKDKGNEVSMFLQSLLRLKGNLIPAEYQKELQGLIASVLPETPPYEQIFRPGKNTIKALICIPLNEVLNGWLDNRGGPFKEFKLVVNDGKGKRVYQKEVLIGGEKKEIVLEMHTGKTWVDYGKIVDNGMSDDNVDILIVSGHATSEIPKAFEQVNSKSGKAAKMIMINACWSARYYPKIQYFHPHFQVISTGEQATAEDGSPILKALLDVIVQKGRWEDVRDKIKNTPAGSLVSYYGSFLLPNDQKYLEIRDSDGDGDPDIRDVNFNLTVSDSIPKIPDNFDLRPGWEGQPQTFPASDVCSSIHNDHFIKPFLRNHSELNIEVISGSNYQNPGWYEPRDYDETFLYIDEERQQGTDIPLARLRFNAGYAHCADEWLGVMAIAELNRYLSLRYKLDEKPKEKVVRKEITAVKMNAEEKKRELRFIAHYLATAYSVATEEKKVLLERIFEKAKQKYDLPPISFQEMVLYSGVVTRENAVAEKLPEEVLKRIEDFFAGFNRP